MPSTIYLSTLNSTSTLLDTARFDGEKESVPATNSPTLYGQLELETLGRMLTFYTNSETRPDDTGPDGGLGLGNFIAVGIKAHSLDLASALKGVVGGTGADACAYTPFRYPATLSEVERADTSHDVWKNGVSDVKSGINGSGGIVRVIAETAANTITGHRSGLDLFSNKQSFGDEIFDRAQGLIKKVNAGGDGSANASANSNVTTQAINGYLATAPERFALKYKSILSASKPAAAEPTALDDSTTDNFAKASLYKNLVARVYPHETDDSGGATNREPTAVLVSVLMGTDSGEDGLGKGKVEMIQAMKKSQLGANSAIKISLTVHGANPLNDPNPLTQAKVGDKVYQVQTGATATIDKITPLVTIDGEDYSVAEITPDPHAVWMESSDTTDFDNSSFAAGVPDAEYYLSGLSFVKGSGARIIDSELIKKVTAVLDTTNISPAGVAAMVTVHPDNLLDGNGRVRTTVIGSNARVAKIVGITNDEVLGSPTIGKTLSVDILYDDGHGWGELSIPTTGPGSFGFVDAATGTWNTLQNIASLKHVTTQIAVLGEETELDASQVGQTVSTYLRRGYAVFANGVKAEILKIDPPTASGLGQVVTFGFGLNVNRELGAASGHTNDLTNPFHGFSHTPPTGGGHKRIHFGSTFGLDSVSEASFQNYGFRGGDRVVITDELCDTNVHIAVRNISDGFADKLNGIGESEKYNSTFSEDMSTLSHTPYDSTTPDTDSSDMKLEILNWEKGVYTGVVLKDDDDEFSAKAILTVRVGSTEVRRVSNLTVHSQINDDGTPNVWHAAENKVVDDVAYFGDTDYYTYARHSGLGIGMSADEALPFSVSKNYCVRLGDMLSEVTIGSLDHNAHCYLSWYNDFTLGKHLNSIQTFALNDRLRPRWDVESVTSEGTTIQIGAIDDRLADAIPRRLLSVAQDNIDNDVRAHATDVGPQMVIPDINALKYNDTGVNTRAATTFNITHSGRLNGYTGVTVAVEGLDEASLTIPGSQLGDTDADNNATLTYDDVAEVWAIAGTAPLFSKTYTFLPSTGDPAVAGQTVFWGAAGAPDPPTATLSVTRKQVEDVSGNISMVYLAGIDDTTDYAVGDTVAIVGTALDGLATTNDANFVFITQDSGLVLVPATLTTSTPAVVAGDEVMTVGGAIPALFDSQKGSGAVFTVTRGIATYSAVSDAGNGHYEDGDVITVAGSELGGTDTDNNATLTYNAATGLWAIAGVSAGATADQLLVAQSKNSLSAQIPIEEKDRFIVIGKMMLAAEQTKVDGNPVNGEGDSTMEMVFTVTQEDALIA